MTSQTYTPQELARRLEEIGGSLVRLDFRLPLAQAKLLIVEDLKSNFDQQRGPNDEAWPPLAHTRPDGTGTNALWDKGALVRSVGAGPGHVERMTSTSLEIGTNLEYARIHQIGGTVEAKPGKALAIPLTREAKKAGRARDFPRSLFLFKRKSESRPPLLAEALQKNRGRWTQLIFHYVLVKSVKIPARPFIGVGPRLAPKIDKLFLDHLERETRL